MSAVSATTTGVSDLMKTLSSVEPPSVSSLLSSSSVQSALAKASAADIVQLSDQAMQLQEVGGLFGAASTQQPTAQPTYNPNLAMQNLLTSIYTGSSVDLLG